MPIYKVKGNSMIEHDGKPYFGGRTIELPEELAALHGDNLEPIKVEKPTDISRAGTSSGTVSSAVSKPKSEDVK